MDPAKFKLTIDLTRILFPYILLVGLTAYCMGVLNTLKHFAAPAFASTVWNAVIIAIMLIYFRSFEITHLVIAILFGGIAQLACQIFPLVRKGPFFNVRDGLAHEGAKKVGRLLMPRVVGAGIYQINIVVDRMLASLHLIVGQGAVAALYYGNRLFHLPLALFSVALATAALPVMSSLAVEKDAATLPDHQRVPAPVTEQVLLQCRALLVRQSWDKLSELRIDSDVISARHHSPRLLPPRAKVLRPLLFKTAPPRRRTRRPLVPVPRPRPARVASGRACSR